MDEAEKRLLEQIAAARGVTIESLTGELLSGSTPQPVGKAEPQEAEAPQPLNDPVVTFSAAKPVAVPSQEEAPLPPPAEEFQDEASQAESAYGSAADAATALLQPQERFNCQHCGWVLAEPVVEQPTVTEITNFLHCCLGQKLYSADYKLLGGKLTLRVRALRVRELEAIYDSAHRLQALGTIQGQGGYYEYINRMRVYLQLTRIGISLPNEEKIIQLPEILDASVCRAKDFDWVQKLRTEGERNEHLPLLDQVRDYMISNVVNTEHLHRLLGATCAKFNRKIAMLEARMEDANFWNEQGLQT